MQEIQITKRVVYSVLNQDFDSEEKARACIFDMLGETLDKGFSKFGIGALGPRERLLIARSIADNPATIAGLLLAYSGKVFS